MYILADEPHCWRNTDWWRHRRRRRRRSRGKRKRKRRGEEGGFNAAYECTGPHRQRRHKFSISSTVAASQIPVSPGDTWIYMYI